MRERAIGLELNAAGREAVKAFRDAKPWRGTPEERLAKFTELHRGLARAYDLETILIREGNDEEGASAGSCFAPRVNRIVLRGKLSVVTYLFCFALACGLHHIAALAWAKDTFRHFFPRSFARCTDVGGMLVNFGF